MLAPSSQTVFRGKILARPKARTFPVRSFSIFLICASAVSVLSVLRASVASDVSEKPSLIALADIESRLARQVQVEALFDQASLEEKPKAKAAPSVRTVRISKPAPSNVSISSRNFTESPERAPRQPSSMLITQQVEEVIRRHGRKGVDPSILARRIVSESAQQQFDPLFVAAVIKSESAFDRMAASHVGAQGLMQIMPATSKFIEGLDDFEPVMNGKLTDPNYNVRLGIRYLKHLEETYKGNRVFVLTAYNWGPGRVKDAFEGKRRIPPEVMNYALKILGDHQRWKQEAYQALSINAA